MLYPTDSDRYLKIHLNKYLSRKHQINNAAIKLTLTCNAIQNKTKCRYKSFKINSSCSF